MLYQLYLDKNGLESSYIKRNNEDGSVSYIPNDLTNSDWQAYQIWLSEDPENNIPAPADGE